MNSMLEGAFRFENFVVGAPNRLATAAARAVAETPGEAYNPLFIYGESGLGKTHLVAAIAWHARNARPSLRIELTSGEDVVERKRHSESGVPEKARNLTAPPPRGNV